MFQTRIHQGLVVTLVIFLIVMLVSGCGGGSEEEPPEEETTTQVETTTQEQTVEEETIPEEVSEEEPSGFSTVVLLIIDDFSRLDLGELAELQPPPVNQNCITDPDGFGHYGASGLGHYGASGLTDALIDTPHGDLVLSEVQTLLELEGGSPISATTEDLGNFFYTGSVTGWEEWLKSVEVWQIDDKDIVVATVKTEGFTTEIISSRVSDAIDLFSSGTREIDGLPIEETDAFVLNMSFGIVPCSLDIELGDEGEAQLHEMYDNLTDLSDGEELTDEEKAILIYLGAFLGKTEAVIEADYFSNPQALLDELGAFLGVPSERVLIMLPEFRAYRIQAAHSSGLSDLFDFFNSDPLLGNLEEQQSQYIIPVGAAGNSGPVFDFPFAPAIWDVVASISSSGMEASGLASYSNYGEIAMDGQHPTVSGVEGTSFAAPRFSVKVALYLARAGLIPCEHDASLEPGFVTPVPILGYATDTGPWHNISLVGASDLYCKAFVP